MILARLAALQHSCNHLSYQHHKSNFSSIVTYGVGGWAAIRSAHIRHSADWAKAGGARWLTGQTLFAGLHQRTMAARAPQQRQEPGDAGGKQNEIEAQRVEHQIGPDYLVD